MLCLIPMLILSAGILGIIIASMEGGEFPGWGKMVVCVLAALVPEAILSQVLAPELFIVPLVAGAVCATFAIAGACGMELKCAAIASGIYLAIRIAMGVVLYLAVTK